MNYFKLLNVLSLSLCVLHASMVMAMDEDPSKSRGSSIPLSASKKSVLAYQGPNQSICFISSTDGENWGPVRSLPGRMLESPAVKSFSNKLYYAVHGIDHRIWISSTSDGENWSDSYPIKEPVISFSPSLANFQDKLLIAVHGGDIYGQPDGNIWYAATSDGIAWQPTIKLPIKSKVEGSPSLSVFNNKLYCGYSVKDGDNGPNKFMYTATPDGVNWGTEMQVTDAYTYTQSASFAVFNNNLYCFYNASGEVCYTQTADGNTWASGQKIPKVKLSYVPALSVINGKLYCSCQREGHDKQLWYTSTSNGLHWGAEKLIPNAIIENSLALATFTN